MSLGQGFQGWVEHNWYQGGPLAQGLRPLAGLFCAVARGRRLAYRRGLLRSVRLPVPVVVVGNLTVGGAGKTPLVIRLAQLFKAQGFRPGVVSRGYGGVAEVWPQPVDFTSDPVQVGDEPVLIATATGCPVAVAPDRPAAAQLLLERHGCDLIIADDGLQHYRLARDIEIAVLDGGRRLGNGYCLPAGPLREPPGRLATVDLTVANGSPLAGEFGMELVLGEAVRLDGSARLPLAEFTANPVHAVAGIGHPPRFFTALRASGLTVIEHPFPDHHPYHPEELLFGDPLPVLLTGKDAVKCRDFYQPQLWQVPVTAVLSAEFEARLLALLHSLRP